MIHRFKEFLVTEKGGALMLAVGIFLLVLAWSVEARAEWVVSETGGTTWKILAEERGGASKVALNTGMDLFATEEKIRGLEARVKKIEEIIGLFLKYIEEVDSNLTMLEDRTDYLKARVEALEKLAIGLIDLKLKEK